MAGAVEADVERTEAAGVAEADPVTQVTTARWSSLSKSLPCILSAIDEPLSLR